MGFFIYEYLSDMKQLIKKILYESLKDEMISNAKKELDSFESEYGDIIKRHKELKLLVNKLEYLKNIDYKVHVVKGYGDNIYYSVQVNFPFVDMGEKRYPWFNIMVGRKDDIDDMSSDEKEKLFQNKITSYLMKKFMPEFIS